MWIDTWMLNDLALKLELSDDLTQQKLNYWVANGILKRNGVTYHVVEDVELHETIGDADEADLETAVSSDAQQAQEIQVRFDPLGPIILTTKLGAGIVHIRHAFELRYFDERSYP